jgi:hypothetical protein
MTSIDSEFQAQLLVIQKKREQQYALLENNDEDVDAIDEEIDQYANREIELVKDINIKVGGNQIYRLATWVATRTVPRMLNGRRSWPLLPFGLVHFPLSSHLWGFS